jgi:hypothetical protein
MQIEGLQRVAGIRRSKFIRSPSTRAFVWAWRQAVGCFAHIPPCMASTKQLASRRTVGEKNFQKRQTPWKPASALGLQSFLGHLRSRTRRKSKARLYAGFCAARRRAVAVIPLGRRSRAGSSHLPAASPSRIAGCLFGVAPRRDCPFHPPAPRLRASQETRLCCSDPHLAVDRCYLLRRSSESGRSSRRRTCQRPPSGLCCPDCRAWGHGGLRPGGRRPSRPGATAAARRCA